MNQAGTKCSDGLAPSAVPASLPAKRSLGVLVLCAALLAAGPPPELGAQQSPSGTDPATIPVPRDLAPAARPGPGAAAPSGTTPAARPAALGAIEEAKQLLARARELRGEGLLREAHTAYRSWLERNPNDPEFSAVLGEAVDWTPDVPLSVELLRRYAGQAQEPELRDGFRSRQARLLAALGRTEEALELLAAPDASPEHGYLRAVLLYELGAFDESLAVAREALSGFAPGGGVDTASAPELEGRLYFLMAQIHGVLGRAGEAESLYLLLTSRFVETGIAPASFLEYSRHLSAAGRGAEAAAMAAELRRRYPDSPETLLAEQPPGSESGAGEGPSVVYASSPLRLLSGALLGQKVPADTPKATEAPKTTAPRPPEAPAAQTPKPVEAPSPREATKAAAAPAPAPAPAPAGVALVQTGSFRDPENAQYMVRDLKARGFTAEILEKRLGGNLYYRVVIGPAMSAEQAQTLMVRLKQSGFEGFLLFLD